MRTFQEHNQISVVIPTLNAAAELAKSLAPLENSAIIREIVVADGGSHDDTVAVARAAGARVVSAARGRGNQLAAGAATASADWLLFLHADCLLSPDWENAATGFIAHPGADGRAGYFALVFDDAAPAARRLERMVAWRCRVLGLPYGDQGLLISRRLYDAVGGFAPVPLMEDVDLVRRLGPKRLVPLDASALTSARRYQTGGYICRPLRNLMCLALYFAGVSPHRIARLYG